MECYKIYDNATFLAKIIIFILIINHFYRNILRMRNIFIIIINAHEMRKKFVKRGSGSQIKFLKFSISFFTLTYEN